MYQGYLISNFNTGYHTTKEPWMAPRDAFTYMENAHCVDGILQSDLALPCLPK